MPVDVGQYDICAGYQLKSERVAVIQNPGVRGGYSSHKKFALEILCCSVVDESQIYSNFFFGCKKVPWCCEW